MAKVSLAERLKAIDGIAKKINENAKKDIVGRVVADSGISSRLQVDFIKTPSINVNTAIGGGWPKGNISILCGNPDSGKTFLMLETIAEEQKRNPDFIALWLEAESSLKERTLDQVGIDKERFVVIEHDREGAAEEAVNRLEAFMQVGVADIVVINSLRCLVPSEEFKKDMGSLQVGLQARFNAKLVRKLTAVVEESNAAMVIIQHLTTQIGGMTKGDPKVLAGGEAIRYAAMLIVDVRKRSIQEADPISRDEGIKIGVTVKKNHIVTDRNPYVTTEYYGIYGQGTEKYLEALKLAVDQGVLAKAGSFIKVLDENGEVAIVDGEKMQWQGGAKFREYCIQNPEFFEDLVKEISGSVTDIDGEDEEPVTGDDNEDPIEKASNNKKGKKK